MVLIIFYRYMMNNRGILTPRAPYNGIQQSLHIFSRASFNSTKTRLFYYGLFFLIALSITLNKICIQTDILLPFKKRDIYSSKTDSELQYNNN